jgi:predicted nucleic acid-binding Zn ribbon protein
MLKSVGREAPGVLRKRLSTFRTCVVTSAGYRADAVVRSSNCRELIGIVRSFRPAHSIVISSM